jgi:hypothetical protein
LFINFFGWTKVPSPELDDVPIPVFGIGIEHFQTYSIANIAFNPDILKKYGRNSNNLLETQMLIDLALNFIQDQNKDLEYSEKSKYEILNKIDFKGDLEATIQKLTSKTKSNKSQMNDLKLAKDWLSSIDSKSNENLPDGVLNKLINLNLNQSPSKNESNHEINTSRSVILDEPNDKAIMTHKSNLILEIPHYEEKIVYNNENNNKIEIVYKEIKIQLPNVKSMSECELNFESDSIILISLQNNFSDLKISLEKLNANYAIKTDDIEAKFFKKSSILRIRIPLSKSKE